MKYHTPLSSVSHEVFFMFDFYPSPTPHLVCAYARRLHHYYHSPFPSLKDGIQLVLFFDTSPAQLRSPKSTK